MPSRYPVQEPQAQCHLFLVTYYLKARLFEHCQLQCAYRQWGICPIACPAVNSRAAVWSFSSTSGMSCQLSEMRLNHIECCRLWCLAWSARAYMHLRMHVDNLELHLGTVFYGLPPPAQDEMDPCAHPSTERQRWPCIYIYMYMKGSQDPPPFCL